MLRVIRTLLFFVVLILSVPVLAQSDFEATRARAEAGDAEAQNELGLMYEKGTGVDQSYQEALKWFRLAAEQGLEEALYGIAAIQAQTRSSTPPRPPQQRCSSNSSEINNQITRLSAAYDARFEVLRRRSLQAGLAGLGAYGLGGFSRGVEESGLERERDQLILQKARDIADLRSRIVEICDPIPAPRDNSAAIERGTSIATTPQELNELFESGAITEEDFQATKRNALGLD